MKYILGVDAAWTSENPSGIALIKSDSNTLSVVIIARSYEEFLSWECDWSVTPKGTPPNFRLLIERCESKGVKVDLVSLDIPLSPERIFARRESDSQISRCYGSFGASTHSPSTSRPGVHF